VQQRQVAGLGRVRERLAVDRDLLLRSVGGRSIDCRLGAAVLKL
jgi:hypothetical protein